MSPPDCSLEEVLLWGNPLHPRSELVVFLLIAVAEVVNVAFPSVALVAVENAALRCLVPGKEVKERANVAFPWIVPGAEENAEFP